MKELGSGVEPELQSNSVVDTVQGQPIDDSAIANSKEGEIYNTEDPERLTLSGLVGDEKHQNSGGHATPTYEGLHIHPEKDRAALKALDQVEGSPVSQAGVISVPDGKRNHLFTLYTLSARWNRPCSSC